MSAFITRPERGSRLFSIPAFVVPGVPTVLATFGPVGQVSALLIEAPRANTLPVEFGSVGFVAGNGVLLYPGDSVEIKIDNATKVSVVDPAASGLQTLRVVEIA